MFKNVKKGHTLSMYIFNPDFTQKQAKQKEASQKIQPVQDTGPGFQSVLGNLIHQKAVESSGYAEDRNIRKKKKDTTEIFEDYKEQKANQHDVLEMEGKIRKIFRKIRVEV